MVRIHTAQLNVGKAIPYNSNVLFLDITVKSGVDLLEKALAPTWDMVTASKAGGSNEDYLRRYLPILEAAADDFHSGSGYKWIFSNKGTYTDVVLGCYCKFGCFCHRHAAAKFLAAKYKAVYVGEIDRSNISIEIKPLTYIYHVSNASHRHTDELKLALDTVGDCRVVDMELYDSNVHDSGEFFRELSAKCVSGMVNLDFTGVGKDLSPLLYDLSRERPNVLSVSNDTLILSKSGPLDTDIAKAVKFVKSNLIRTQVTIVGKLESLDYEAAYDVAYENVRKELQGE